LPDVPVLTEEIKAPATVAVPLIVKDTAVAVFDPAEVEPKVIAGRLPEYGVTSDQPACDASVSPTAAVPVPFNPRNHAAV
jgi:hypothetical protein